MEQIVGRLERKTRVKTRKDHVRNKTIQEDAKVCKMSTFLRQQRLHWYGHVKRREQLIKKNDARRRTGEEEKGAT